MSRVHSIEELKQKCAEKNMPLKKMRFFIGENRHEPKCFGVYQDEKTGNWIVYKNKANGQRAIRYSGPDEARAAQEIWKKIGDEVKLRKDRYANPYDDSAYETRTTPDIPKTIGNVFLGIIGLLFSNIYITIAAILIFITVLLEILFPSPSRGYYQVNDRLYYYLSDSWYMYDSGDWVKTSYLSEDDLDNYYLGDTYSSDYDASDFTDTAYYETYLEEQNNNDYDDYEYDDDDYDYDYDTWDTGDTDWDTDW